MEPRVDVINGELFALVHDCNALCGDGATRLLPNRSTTIVGPQRWTVTGPDEKATVDPSILCEACGLHGYWRNGAWEAA